MPDAFHELPSGLHPRTVMARAGHLRSQFMETCEAVYMSSGYVYKTAEQAESAFANEGSRFVYSRYANPTVAVFASLACQVKAGDRVVASRARFNSCNYIITQVLPRYGVVTELVDGRDLKAWEKALAPGVKAVFCESPSNPTLELIDIAAVAALTHRAGGVLVVDNVFATPLLQRPLALGADIVVYSATKHIDGQGRSLGGAVLGSDAYVRESLMPFLRHTGPALSPFNAWLLLKGIETLDLRVDRQCRSATEIAQFLERHPRVERVLYPGLESHPQYQLARQQMSGPSTLMALSVGGGKAGAFRFQNALRLIEISNNLGDGKSLVTHPATTTHHRLKPEERQVLGIGDGLVRLSVGLEDPADLVADLDQALKAA